MRSCMRLGGRRLLRDRVNLEAFAGDVARIGNDRVAFVQSRKDFHAVAEIAPHREGLQTDGVIGLHDRDEGAPVRTISESLGIAAAGYRAGC